MRPSRSIRAITAAVTPVARSQAPSPLSPAPKAPAPTRWASAAGKCFTSPAWPILTFAKR